MTHRAFVRVLSPLAATGAILLLALSASAAGGPTVQPNGQVNTDKTATRTHDAPSLAVNPANPTQIAMGEIDLQRGQCLTHISSDAGHTWSAGASPQNSEYVNCGPQNGNLYNTGASTQLVYDRQGTLYYAFAAARAGDGDSRSILLGKSTDNGKSYTTTVVYQATTSADPTKADVNYHASVAVDLDSPTRVYVGWARTYNFDANKLDAGVVAASSDGGKTFGSPVDVGFPAQDVSLVVSKGNLIAVSRESTPFPPPAPPKLYAAKSTDHGKTFTNKVVDPGSKRSSSPVAAVDPTNGTIVMAWYDNHLAAPKTVQDNVLVKSSADGGTSWTDSVPVSLVTYTAGRNINQLYPALAFAPNGRLDVAWYDYRNDPFEVPADVGMSNLGKIADVYQASSTNDGKSFGPAIRLSDHPIDRRIGTWNGQYFFVIPPAIASANNMVYAAWSDTRNGNTDTQAQDIFFTRGDLAPAAATASSGVDWRVVLLAVEVLLLGLGLGLLIATLWMRRRRAPIETPVETRTPAGTPSR